MSLTKEDLVWRLGLMCCACIRNIAHHRAGLEYGVNDCHPPFKKDAHNNFFFVAVLEWCKVFEDEDAKQYWPGIISDPYGFLFDMLEGCSLTTEEYEKGVKKVATFRDKFVAHLDAVPPDTAPSMDLMLKTSTLLYDHLHEHDGKGVFPWDAPAKGETLYGLMLAEALEEYGV